MCYRVANPLNLGIFNQDMSQLESGWRCSSLTDAVEMAKWSYYASRTLRYLESKLPGL